MDVLKRIPRLGCSARYWCKCGNPVDIGNKGVLWRKSYRQESHSPIVLHIILFRGLDSAVAYWIYIATGIIHSLAFERRFGQGYVIMYNVVVFHVHISDTWNWVVGRGSRDWWIWWSQVGGWAWDLKRPDWTSIFCTEKIYAADSIPPPRLLSEKWHVSTSYSFPVLLI